MNTKIVSESFRFAGTIHRKMTAAVMSFMLLTGAACSKSEDAIEINNNKPLGGPLTWPNGTTERSFDENNFKKLQDAVAEIEKSNRKKQQEEEDIPILLLPEETESSRIEKFLDDPNNTKFDNAMDTKEAKQLYEMNKEEKLRKIQGW